MFKTFREMREYVNPYKWKLILGSSLTLLFAILALVDPYVTGFIIDAVQSKEKSNIIIIGILILLAVTIFRTGLRYIYFILFEEISQKIIYQLRHDLYEKLQGLDFTYYDREPNGKIMSKMTGDIEAIRHFYAWITHVTVFHVAVFVFAIISMIIINPLLAASLLFIIPIIGFFSIRLSKNVKPTFVRIREQFSKLNTVVQENISGNRVVKAFARERYEVDKFQVENEGYRTANLESAKVWEENLPALDAFAVLFNVVVILLGSYFIIHKQMTLGELVSFNRLLWMINNPLRMVGWLINGTQNFVASFEKVKELLDEESKIKEVSDPIQKKSIEGFVTFEDVSFHYEDLPVLNHVSFEVQPGQTVALLGATGSGKSTLTALISRFYDPTEGCIYIDHEPIGDYNINSLRQNISVAMQDIFLFSDTIEGNISYGVPEASKQRVQHAAEIAGVGEFVHQFDDSYSTIIGERGVGLSGGQKQRIALARAIVEDPAILILDDTTSAVDMETEYKILTELKKLNKKRTTFIIAHRISSVKDADIILVMDEGKIIERGNHEDLLAQEGYYAEVFNRQMGEFDSIKETI